jgi:hypothetical protein
LLTLHRRRITANSYFLDPPVFDSRGERTSGGGVQAVITQTEFDIKLDSGNNGFTETGANVYIDGKWSDRFDANGDLAVIPAPFLPMLNPKTVQML